MTRTSQIRGPEPLATAALDAASGAAARAVRPVPSYQSGSSSQSDSSPTEQFALNYTKIDF